MHGGILSDGCFYLKDKCFLLVAGKNVVIGAHILEDAFLRQIQVMF